MECVNFMEGEYALPTNLDKGRSFKLRINNSGRLSDDMTGDEKYMLHDPVKTLNRYVKQYNLDK